jgi:hypothetical protein
LCKLFFYLILFVYSDNGEINQHDQAKDSALAKNGLPPAQIQTTGVMTLQRNNCANDPHIVKSSNSELNSTSHPNASRDFGNNYNYCIQDKYARLSDLSQGKNKRKFDEELCDHSVMSPSNHVLHILPEYDDTKNNLEKRFKSEHSVTKSEHQNDPNFVQHLKQLNHPSETQTSANLDLHRDSVTKNVSSNTAHNLGRDFLLPKNLFSSSSSAHPKNKKRYE